MECGLKNSVTKGKKKLLSRTLCFYVTGLITLFSVDELTRHK